MCGTFAVLLLALTTASNPVQESKSALETDPSGWVDILPGKDLQGWRRVAIPPGGKLTDKQPWTVADDVKTLVCNGVGVHEMLLFDKAIANCIFHVEWRFQKVDDKARYNSGVYVRNSADGKVWHQAQVGDRNVGFLFGDTLVDGQIKRVRIDDKAPQRGKEAGAWNVYEITSRSANITLWVNGAVTTEWKDCRVLKGQLGLEAEGYVIEFRNLKIKELK